MCAQRKNKMAIAAARATKVSCIRESKTYFKENGKRFAEEQAKNLNLRYGIPVVHYFQIVGCRITFDNGSEVILEVALKL